MQSRVPLPTCLIRVPLFVLVGETRRVVPGERHSLSPQPAAPHVRLLQVPREQEILDVGLLSDDTDTTDTQADDTAQPLGAGPQGFGQPLQIQRGRRRRALQDGGGLCSPGRWAPWDRPTCRAPKVMALRAAIQRELQRLRAHEEGDQVKKIFERIAAQKCEGAPFPVDRTAALQDYAEKLYGDEARPRRGDRKTAIRVRLLQALLKDAQDADYASIDIIAQGVPIGVNHRLPRTPAVYPRRRKWKLDGQGDPNKWLQRWEARGWRTNYSSATEVADEIESQLLALVAEDKAGMMSEAELRDRWPDAAVASLGAITKEQEDGTTKVRMLYDGTSGVDVNTHIRVRDKDRGPATPDVKCILHQQARTGRRTIGITADVKDAHRSIPVREEDWKYQVCRARPSPSQHFFFKCGVFGIASAAYWWGRLAAGLLRALHHVGEPALEAWILLVADDFKIESTAADPERAVLFLLWLMVILDVPLQWHKSRGGADLEWVGYSFSLASHSLGLSTSRAAWAVAWCTRHATAGGGTIGELREGVGRLSFAVGALTFDAPFLSPLYAYIAVCRSSGYRRYPRFVRITLQYLADRIQRRRMYPCGSTPTPLEHGPRVDAAADGSIIGIGGWLPMKNGEGEISTAISPWFAIRLTREVAPWAFTKQGEPYRSIAALGAVGTLLAIKLFSPWLTGGLRGAVSLRAYTDNQGNVSALSRLTSSTYPLNCVAMELATTLEQLDLRLDLRWLPRGLNAEADALSKGQFAGFTAAHRISVSSDSLAWHVLPSLMELGAEFYRDIQQRKALGEAGAVGPKRRRADRLRNRDPW